MIQYSKLSTLQNRHPHMPMYHFSQPTAFHALNRKACGTHRHGTTALQGKQQHDVNSVRHTVTDDRKKSKGLVTAVLVGAIRINNTARNKRNDFFLPFPRPKQRLEDCKAWIRACGWPHDQTLDQHTWSSSVRQKEGFWGGGEGGRGANTVQARSRKCLLTIAYVFATSCHFTTKLIAQLLAFS